MPIRKTPVAEATALEPVTDDANGQIAFTEPYVARLRIRGTAALLFHRWSVESVAEKAAAAKGSRTKKSDDVESYVYRNDKKEICLPGEYLRQAICMAAKFKQDPRSPRASALNIFKAGIAVVDELCSLGAKNWDYLDQRRVVVQRNAITRQRPAMLAGWETDVSLLVQTPEYISRDLLLDVATQAGKLVGVGDFRPTYGRFAIVRFDISEA
jgi:hypothetical protein